jgi:aminoglycoside/choline kinase family phosphotransferase
MTDSGSPPFDDSRDLWTATLAGRGIHLTSWQPLAGDVSPRRYVRVSVDGRDSAILALYPPEVHGTCARFQAAGELLAKAGIRGPAVRAADCEGGWMLLEDAGLATLAERADLAWEAKEPYFREAAAIAGRIAGLPAGPVAALNPALDGALLERELRQTWDLFLLPKGLAGEGGFQAALWELLAEVCRRAAAAPPVPCHRDFMARNLIPLAGDGARLVVLDHQDLRLGPAAYDLASLLNDTLFPPPALEEELLAAAGWAGERRLDYHRAAAQRTLKAIGTYVSFSLRGAPRHLPLVPPTFERALAHLSLLPEAAPRLGRIRGLWERFLYEPNS